jgi:hypothetical protein
LSPSGDKFFGFDKGKIEANSRAQCEKGEALP